MKRNEAYTIPEIMTVLVLFVLIGLAILTAFNVVKNSYFRGVTQIELQDKARFASARVTSELSISAPSRVSLYRCPDSPDNVCHGGVVAFQTPVVNDFVIAGSIYKRPVGARRLAKWGYDGREVDERIIYMVPKANNPQLGSYAHQLIRLTRKPYCGDGFCDVSHGEDEGLTFCSADCLCGNGHCSLLESVDTCEDDCFCGNGTCDMGEDDVLCGQDCFCGNGRCDPGEAGAGCEDCSDCGNGICESGESNAGCSIDCSCPNGSCDPDENSDTCPADCPVASLRNLDIQWIEDFFVQKAFAQDIPDPPDIAAYEQLPDLLEKNNYFIRVIADKVQAIYFEGIPGPGTGGMRAPENVRVYIKMQNSGNPFAQELNIYHMATARLINSGLD